MADTSRQPSAGLPIGRGDWSSGVLASARRPEPDPLLTVERLAGNHLSLEEDRMTIAPKLRQFLDRQHAVYELIDHPLTLSAAETAAAAHIPPSCMAKAVLLDTPHVHLLAVLPSDRRIDLDDLRDALGEKLQGGKARLADEDEIAIVFDDCAPGAVPPLGFSYGVTMIVDDHLANEPDVFFEAGDHRSLVHMEQAEFRRLTGPAQHCSFGTLRSFEE